MTQHNLRCFQSKDRTSFCSGGMTKLIGSPRLDVKAFACSCDRDPIGVLRILNARRSSGLPVLPWSVVVSWPWGLAIGATSGEMLGSCLRWAEAVGVGRARKGYGRSAYLRPEAQCRLLDCDRGAESYEKLVDIARHHRSGRYLSDVVCIPHLAAFPSNVGIGPYQQPQM